MVYQGYYARARAMPTGLGSTFSKQNLTFAASQIDPQDAAPKMRSW